MMEPTLESNSDTISMKRKIDEAFDALDDALHPTDRPTPPKRTNTSIYGSLAKYGISTFSKPSASKLNLTPTLSALLSRSRSKNQRKPLVIPQAVRSPFSIPDYSPSSTEAFLQRLSTFSLSTYPSKPPQIDAVAASKTGWINEGGKDRLYCAICKSGWVIAARDGMNKNAGDALIEKQRKSLVDMHKAGCPWRDRQCDPLVYRIPLQSPTGLARQIKCQAAELDHIIHGVAIRHPLSSTQVQILVKVIASVPALNAAADSSAFSPPNPALSDRTEPPHPGLPSTTSILTSLFGWSLLPPPPLIPRTSSANLTIARTHSRALSVPATVGSSREGTPSPSVVGTPVPLDTPIRSDPMSSLMSASSSNVVASAGGRDMDPHPPPPQQKDALLQCRMCQRRVGLWAFVTPNPLTSTQSQQTPSTDRPQRQLDILREHRSYCPYVVKSTPLPSVPPPSTPASPFPSSLTGTGTSSSVMEEPNNTSTFNLRRTASLISRASSFARTRTFQSSEPPVPAGQCHNIVEGWRAVLSVVLRYGMAERSRVPPSTTPGSPYASRSARGTAENDEDDAMSGVVALVDGVKQHGGKQLLGYVRSLLG